MGYYQENFPGSAAAKQRLRLAKGLVAYSVLLGFSIYKFAPAIRRYDKEIAEGRVPMTIPLLDYMVSRVKNRGLTGARVPKVDEVLEGLQEKERMDRFDFMGPKMSKETVKKTYVG